MKKTLLFFLIISTFGVLNLKAGDRMVIVERFTSWTCGPCASNNPIMEAFLNAQDPDKIRGIAFHMNWPAPGNDGFYLENPGDNTTRRNFYAVNYIPQAKMDGVQHVEPPYSQSTLLDYFNTRSAILSPVTIIVTDSTYGDSVRVRATIFCEAPLQNPNVTVHFAVIERYIHYASAPGTNGERDFYDVMRKMLPSASGTIVSLYVGQTVQLEQRFKIQPNWQSNQVKTLVFVQGTLEVLGTGIKTSNFTLLPSPALRIVNQGSNQTADYRVRTPDVVSGYNSPITFTAEVQPPTAGVSVAFPNGNVMSNYSDSLLVRVSSSSSVPAGAYKIILTGTNTNNKVHKTTVNYLVGMNYVYINSNRPNNQLQFMVDNQTYSSIVFNTWNVGSVHNVSAISPQTFSSVRYRFLNWSDGGAFAHPITIGTVISNYTVNYQIQYKLIALMNPSDIPATITGGNDFYDSASTANLSISPLQVQYNNQTWYFQRWEGTGYTGPLPNPQIQMNTVTVETAIWDTINPIGIHNLGQGVPKAYSLHQNYPNPFNPVTQIKYDVPRQSFVKITVYDILGNEVKVLVSEFQNAGYYSVDFDGTASGSGVYFVRFEAGDYKSVKKMLLVK